MLWGNGCARPIRKGGVVGAHAASMPTRSLNTQFVFDDDGLLALRKHGVYAMHRAGLASLYYPRTSRRIRFLQLESQCLVNRTSY